MYEEATIKTQVELDFALAVAREHVKNKYRLIVKSDADRWLTLQNQLGNTDIVARESSHVVARESSHVEAWESSHVEAWGSSHVVARGSSHVEAWESSHVEARGSSHVEAWESSHVEAWGSSHVEAYQYAIVRKASNDAKLSAAGDSVIVDSTQRKRFTDALTWLDWWGVKPENGTVVLFKAVQPTGFDFHTGRVKYEVGKEVVAQDWDDKFTGECGYALHCSPFLGATHGYVRSSDHIHLKCQVAVEDIRVRPQMDMPDKCRVRKLLVLRVVKDDGEE